MKWILCGFISILIFCGWGCYALDKNSNTELGMKKADELFQKGLFQEALNEYEQIFNQTDNDDIRWKAFFRICESLSHLFRYGDATERLISTSVPDQMPYRARVLILKAEMLRNFQMQYSRIQRSDIIDDEDEKGVFRLTQDEIKNETRKAYYQLWELRNDLVNMDIKKEEYFINIVDIDFGMYPTFFDYLILSWTDFLLSADEDIKPEADLLLVEEFDQPVSIDDSPVLLAAELMEEASKFKPQGRIEASERWKIKRLLLPLKYTQKFDLKGLAQDENLYDNKDLKEYRGKARDILLKWMGKFTSNEAKGEAGYESAVIFNSNGELVEAVKLCEKVEKDFPGTHASRHARTLRSEIQMPSLSLQAKTVMPPAIEAFTLTTKNLKKVYFRVYKVDPQKIKNEIMNYQRRRYGDAYNRFDGWSNLFSLNWGYQDWSKRLFRSYLLKTPYKVWTFETGDKGDYITITEKVTPPELDKGIYLAFASSHRSFKIGSSLFSACFLNVTDFVLIGTAGFTTKTEDAYYNFIENEGPDRINDDGFHFYTINVKNGKPIGNADLNIYTYLSQRGETKFFDLKTRDNGLASLSLPVGVSPNTYNNYYADPLAMYESSYSYWGSNQYFNYSAPNPITLFIETDRPIYRPGNKVQAKVIVTWRTDQGFKNMDSNKQSVVFSAFDPNGKEFFKQNVELGEFSSADVTFEISQGRLLGRYTLNASYTNGRFQGIASTGFSVEEYKRPEFEITLKPATEAWKYNEPVEIKGEAKYYFGGPVSEASIKYRIKRQIYIPWFYRYWFGQDYSENMQEIASGELKADSDGNFTISFTPPPPPQTYGGNIPDIAQFLVEVEGYDSGGRTIQTQESYKAGKNALFLVIEPKKGFYLEEEKIEINAKLLTINETPSSGTSDYEVFILANIPAEPQESDYGRYGNWIPPLDVQLRNVPNGELMERGKVDYDKDGKGIINLPALPQGTYRIVLKSRDLWGTEIQQSKIFVIAKNLEEAVPLNAYSVTLTEYEEYEVGDIARFIIGSGIGSGVYYMELWVGNHLLSQQLIDDSRLVKLIEIPVTKRMKGGFSLRWFGVKGFNVHNGQATVRVPWKDKKLNIVLEPFTRELEPGKEVNWGIEVKDSKGLPVEAEILALMYDRSLEYYMTSHNIWLDSLYSLRGTPAYWAYTVLEQYGMNLPITEGLLMEILKAFSEPPKEPNLPGLRTWRTWARNGRLRAGSRSMVLSEAAPPEPMLAMDAAVVTPVLAGSEKAELEKKEFQYEEVAKKVEARKEFADTAFFMPHIIAEDGQGQLKFFAPEQLTSWRVKLFAFTKDIKEGKLIEEVATKKKLMVRADLPRFFREKDIGTINAIVHNESENVLEGQLFVDITENGKTINQKLKLDDNKKSFNIKPHSLASFDWMIEVPDGVTTYKVRVVAVTEDLSDAEERELPILPSRQRLIESAFVSLSGKESKDLNISLKDDPTRINESMVLQIDPQLTLSILNTLPFLVEYPYECVEQILNKYVPLSIVNEVYKKYPAISKAVEKIPERKTLTPPWEKDDPRRLTTLMETPWVWQSEGRPTDFPIIDLLDPEIVGVQKELNLNKLKSAQLANGAFPWWPGGGPDPYITLYVLAGFAESRRYGVDVPEDMIQKALKYVNKEIPLLLKAEERELAIVAFAAYVVTSYSPQEYPEARKGHEAAKSWVVFLERHIHALTPFGKAYLAYTYLRLGDKDKAESILDMAMDGTREDPIAGVYWTPEKYSWVWYSDTVEKHAFFLRTLQELRPDDKRIPGMVQWLLFNRKGTVWKSTKASVAAVYALLDYLNQRGALASDEMFKVKWGTKTYSQVVKADDWLDSPIRWQEKGFDITRDMSKANIEKEGPGLAFASLTWTYSTDQMPESSGPGMLELERKFYLRVKEGDSYHLKPIKSGDEVAVGDQIEVQLKINTRSQFEYMHLRDIKAAGFEAETLLSGWKYDPIWFYEEPRDSLTNFFIDWLPHGEYILRYRLKPTKPGIYRIGAASLQSMYAPDMTAHSAGFIIKVVE